MDQNVRTQYQPPQITEYGTLAQLTQGNATGERLDGDFPTGTPFDDLTFS